MTERPTPENNLFENIHNENETVQSSEAQEAKKIALDKLAVLMNDYKDYAVRFVNIAEYERIIATGQLPQGREVFYPKGADFKASHDDEFGFISSYGYDFKYKEPLTFSEYVKREGNGGSWEQTAVAQTFAPNLVKEIESKAMRFGLVGDRRPKGKTAFRDSILETAKLAEENPSRYSTEWTLVINIVKNLDQNLNKAKEFLAPQIYEQLVTLVDEVKAKKELTTQKVTEDIAEIIGTRGNSRRLNFQKPLDESQAHELHKLRGDLIKFQGISAENWEILNQFINDPEFIKQPGNLRKVILALARSIGYAPDRQYQVALILDNSLLGEESHFQYKGWKTLKKGLDQETQQKGLLGVVVAADDRDIVNRTRNISTHSGKFACPVFDRHGVLRYPEPKENK